MYKKYLAEGICKVSMLGLNFIKRPSLKIYQKYARIYLDEYPEQKELRKEWFEKRKNLQNDALKKTA